MQAIPEIKVDITINEERFTRNVNEDLLIEQNSLDECLEKQATLYAYYSVRLQQANCMKDQAEFDYQRIMNEVIKTTRQEFVGSGTKITDKQVMAVVENTPEVLAAKQRFIDFNYKRDTLYSLVRSLEHKKDSLIALAYRRRSELEALGNKVIMASRPKSGIENDI